MILKERFDFLGNYGGGTLPLYDSKHAIEEFKRWFPDLSIGEMHKSLEQGIQNILSQYGLIENRYMIISKKHGYRLPIHVRPDRATGSLVGIIPTTLAPHEIINLKKEIELFVEKHGKAYSQFPLTEEYSYFTSSKGIQKDFDEIEVE